MLVLGRKLYEEIIINGNIRIQVTAIRGDQIKLGIEAPPDVSIHRKEVFDLLPKGDDHADGK